MSEGLINLSVRHAGISGNFDYAFVDRISLNLPLGFNTSDNIQVLPANLGLNRLDICQE